MSDVSEVAAKPINLSDLHQQAQRRLGLAIYHQHMDSAYHPLAQRFRAEQHGPGAALLEADLRELLACPEEALLRMVRMEADSLRCAPPSFIAHQRVVAVSEEHRRTQEGMRPRVSPGELVGQFAARGVSIRAVGADLHVTPADGLSEADRDVLRTYKAGIVAALASDQAAVI